MTDSPSFVRLPEVFSMHRGGELHQARIAYETWGRLSPRRDNALLLFTGLSPSAHAASNAGDPTPGWWEYMIGRGRPIDTDRHYVICVNSLGSCFGSTGPASEDPRTGERYGLDFPELAVEDIARAAHEVVGALGIERLDGVIGASLGGMSALAYSVLYAGGVERLAVLCSAPRAAPFAIAIRSLQREIIRSDPAWKGGRYAPDQQPLTGMRMARKLGLMSYRSADEWEQRFGRERVDAALPFREPFGVEFQVESYLDANARKFIGHFDANAYLYLSRAMDWFDLGEHGGSLEHALGRIGAERCLVVSVESDFLFPLHQQQELADLLRRAGRDVQFAVLPSIQGHDSFLVDKERFAAVVGEFFGDGTAQCGRGGQAATG
ncbi:MAG: homoserine O-acetyltransferase [Gammaproteobacteria bacterium]